VAQREEARKNEKVGVRSDETYRETGRHKECEGRG